MPADRIITVNVNTPGYRNEFGEFVPGGIAPIRTWGRRRDRSQEDIQEEGGARDETRRDWRIRWDSRIADIPVSRLQVVDGGFAWDVLNMVEVTRGGRGRQDLRRRFLDIQGVYTR